nr:helix-turn-helix transcriptional regulator [Ferrimonas balearica]
MIHQIGFNTDGTTVTSYDTIPTVGYRASDSSDPGIDVVDLDRFRQRRGRYAFNPYQPHRVSYFCFVYIEQGQGQHQVDGVLHPYQDGSVIFINQDQIHAFDPNDTPKGKMVNITPTFFSECAANIRNSYFVPFHLSLTQAPVLQMTPELSQSCRVLLAEMTQAISEVDNDPVVVQLLFAALALKLSQHRRDHGNGVDDLRRQRFNEFLFLVEQGFAREREAKHYAEQMHLSYKALNQLCKRCCGRTAKQIIDFRLNLEITRKLSMKGGSIQSIAYDLGFDDTTNFVRYFKRHNGLTPSAYRAAYERDAMMSVDTSL